MTASIPSPSEVFGASPFDWVNGVFADLGLQCSEETRRDAQALIAPVPLISLADPVRGADAVGPAWQAVLNHGLGTGHADLMILLLVHRILAEHSGSAHRSLSRTSRFTKNATWYEIHFRLAGTLHQLVRQALADKEDEVAQRCCREVLREGEVITEVLARVPFNEHKLRLFHGIRGVAALTLARGDTRSGSLLVEADTNLTLSRRYGDATVEHFRYHIEVKVRRVDLALRDWRTNVIDSKELGDGSLEGQVTELLQDAEELLAHAHEMGYVTRELAAAEGDVAFRWGVLLVESADRSGALSEFERSVTAYERAAQLSMTTHAAPDEVLALLRGQARFRAYVALQTLGTEDDDRLDAELDAAVADLALGATRVPADTYPAALLVRARQRLWRTDSAGAMADVNTAIAYVHGVDRLETCQQLLRRADILMAEARLRQAVRTGDINAVEVLVVELAQVQDEPVHAGALAHGARLLCRVRERVDCADKLMEVSHALERQLAKLRRPARRAFVASHAATLAVLALNGAGETRELLRICRLYGQALQDASDPSPVLLKHAGVATLTLAKALLSGDEQDREQAIQLLRDALMLFMKSLDVGHAADRQVDGEHSTGDDFEGRDGSDLDTELDDEIQAVLDVTAAQIDQADGRRPEDADPSKLMCDSRPEDDEVYAIWLNRVPPAEQDLPTAGLESRMGECHMRLYTATALPDHAELAMDYFARSRRRGNRSPELLGLVGDVYYRRGRERRSAEDLRLAVALKQKARDLGAKSRENWSVSCAAYRRLFEITGDYEDFTQAIACASEADKFAPNWPWPAFQLAELSQTPEAPRAEASRRLLTTEDSPLSPLSLALAGQRSELLNYACQRLILNEEFAHDSLGGSDPGAVYVLADPHRLLSSTVVIKEQRTDGATREAAMTAGFGAWVADRGLQGMRVPEVIGMIPLPPTRVRPRREEALVLQRAIGRPVSALVADRLADEEESATDLLVAVELVLKALAAFHTWRGVAPTGGRSRIFKMQHNRMRESLQIISRPVPQHEQKEFWLAVTDLPLLGKRDAHADNWLIPATPGPPRWVALVDLAATAWLPAVFEVAQFIEDFAILPVDADHLETRLSVTQRYLSLLPDELGVAALREDPAKVRQAYETFALVRAAFVLSHLGTRYGREEVHSTGSRQMKRERTAHCEQLIRLLAMSPFPQVAAAAARIAR